MKTTLSIRPLYGCLAIAWMAGQLYGQTSSVANIVRGNIMTDGPPLTIGPLLIELENTQRVVERQHCAPDGSFEFRRVPAGQYELRVTNLHGDLVRREFVSIHEYSESLVVKLPRLHGARPANGTVSVSRLQHRIAPRAFKEFQRSEKVLRQGDLQTSIEHLLQAIRIDPSYMEAHNNLGSRYIAAKEPENALHEFQVAAELDPAAGIVHANLAIAFMLLKRFGEAETAARTATRLDPANVKASYTLGVALAAQETQPHEALLHLRRAEDMFPNARLAAARVLQRLGQSAEAAAELRSYLAAPAVQQREPVRAWLAQLQNDTQ